MSVLKYGLLIALGILLIIIGVVVPHIIQWKVRDAVRDGMTLTGPDDEGYDNWVNGRAATSIRKCIPMELMNPDEFLDGARPNIIMRTEDESWFVSSKQIPSANWSDDQRSVQFASFVQYDDHPDSPGDPDKKFLTVNYVYMYMVRSAGSESNLQISFAAGMLGKMVQAGGVTSFRTNPAFCLAGGICGMAAYAAATSNPVPTMTDTTAGMMVGILAPSAAKYGGYMYNVSVIGALPAGPAKTALIDYMDDNYPFFASHDPGVSMDSALLVGYLNWLKTATFNTLVAGYSTAPAYGFKLTNVTCRELFFKPNPLAQFLTGSKASILKNMSDESEAEIHTLLTGYRDDALLGMDFFTEFAGKTMVTGVAQTDFSLAGRQSSYTPFTDRPDRFTIFFSAFLRFVDCVFTGRTKKVKDIPTNVYQVDGEKLTSVSTEFYNPFQGFLNMTRVSGGIPIFFSAPRMAGADPEGFPSMIDGIGDLQGDEVSYIYVEETTGQAIFAEAQLQLNIYCEFSKGLFPVADFNQTENMMIPVIAGQDRKIINDNAAKSLRMAVVTAPMIEKIIFYVFVIIGCLLVIFAAGMWIYLAYCSDEETEGGDDDADAATATPAAGGEFGVGARASGGTTKGDMSMPVEMNIKHQQQQEETTATNPLFGGGHIRVTAGEDA